MRAAFPCTCLCLLALWSVGAEAQPQVSATPQTLREALAKSGFAEAVLASGARDLDRPLTSWEFSAAGDTFAAAYYFADELSEGNGLGPLHVSRVDRTCRCWTHAPTFDGDTSGSVLRFQITPHHILVELHRSPSAGLGIVLEPTTLGTIARLSGFRLQELSDGSILFSGNMVHFAPTHQQRLLALSLGSRAATEIFPGRQESVVAANYRLAVQTAYAGLPKAKQDELEGSVYGPIDDFDRSLGEITVGEVATRIAFVASYESDRLGEDVPHPALQTVVQCDHQAREKWSCDERELQEAGRAVGVSLARDRDGRFRKEGVDLLLQAVLKGK